MIRVLSTGDLWSISTFVFIVIAFRSVQLQPVPVFRMDVTIAWHRKIITLLKTLLGVFFFFLNWIYAALEQEFCSHQQCHRGRHVCRRLSSLFVDIKGPSPLWATSFPKLGSASKESSLADRPCGCIHFSLCMWWDPLSWVPDSETLL